MEEIEAEELDAWYPYVTEHFKDVLNKKENLEEAIENIKSFRNTKYYTGTLEKFKEIKYENL